MADLSQILAASHSATGTSPQEQPDLFADFDTVSYPADHTVFQTHDTSDAYYVIRSGSVDILDDDIVLETLNAGQGFGEIGLLAGGTRPSAAITRAETELIKIPREGFTRLIEARPDIAIQVFNSIHSRVRRSVLAAALKKSIADYDGRLLPELIDDRYWHTYQSGEVIFEQGAASDTLLIITTGRVSVQLQDGQESRVLGEVSSGSLIGEMGLLGDSNRIATVVAVRETTAVSIDQAMFKQLMTHYPDFTYQVMATIIGRQKNNLDQYYIQKPVSLNFTLLPSQVGLDVHGFGESLLPMLQKHGSAILLDEAAFNTFHGVEQAVQRLPMTLIRQWMNDLEQTYDYVVYVADETWSTWTQCITRNSDRMLLVSAATADPTPGELERTIVANLPEQRYELILLHTPQTTIPAGTAAWLEPRTLYRHHHIRRGDGAHLARLARLLTGNGIGLVLGGGGARGYAHLGVLQALIEAQVPIDAIGSVSMGAVIGGGLLDALRTPDVMGAMRHKTVTYGSRKKLLDMTIPMSALMRSRKVSKAMQGVCGETKIEDGWVPFFCISTNMTKAEVNVHRRGELHQAVRASLSIPGVFSPVVRDDDLMIDGGVMNNFPVDVMRTYLEGGHVIGALVSSGGSSRTYEIDDEINGMRVFLNGILPWRKRERVPSILKTILTAASVNSTSNLDEYRSRTDLLLETNTTPYGILDFDNHAELAVLGYEQHIDKINTWAATHKQLIDQPAPWAMA